MSERNLSDETGGAGGGVRSVSRALLLLDAVTGALERGSEGGVSLADAARLAGLPVTTVARLLRTLEDEEVVERDTAGRYRPGVRLLALASRIKTVPLIEAAGPELEGLARETGESAYLAVRSGDQAVYVRHVDSSQPIRHTAWMGRTWPLEGTAIGAALLGKAARGGVATTRDTVEPGVTAVASPIWDSKGETVVAALSCAGPTYRIDDEQVERMARAVANRAQRLSQLLGA
ncbi:MAG: putative HTH-type transcriptional regulator yagI [Blastococcus sp.]|jgi:IclR family acetate operon transcriptional repressor|nr:putative HTH-type transcriptional regulator yagI [Blastococcus sp.]